VVANISPVALHLSLYPSGTAYSSGAYGAGPYGATSPVTATGAANVVITGVTLVMRPPLLASIGGVSFRSPLYSYIQLPPDTKVY